LSAFTLIAADSQVPDARAFEHDCTAVEGVRNEDRRRGCPGIGHVTVSGRIGGEDVSSAA